jgi:CheY-like chemotaxis protein
MNTAGGLQGLLEISREEIAERADLIPLIEGLVKTIVDEIEGQRHILRAEQGNLQLEWSPLELDQMLAQVTTLYRAHPVARQRTVVLETTTDATVVTDGTLLRRVIGNMIKNALEATPEGGQVTVSAEYEDRVTVVTVHNPVFIPESIQAHIFKRGFSTKGHGRGTGTHAMRIITERYLGGHIEFESRPDTGTRFMLRLPDRPQTLNSAPLRSDAVSAAALRLDGVRVVVADDDAVNRRIAAHRLRRLGADVETVINGSDAIAAVRERGAELVLLDLEMPGLSGLETAIQLRSATARAPHIVIVSGHGASEVEDAPFDLWIEKPIRDADLQRVARDIRAPS